MPNIQSNASSKHWLNNKTVRQVPTGFVLQNKQKNIATTILVKPEVQNNVQASENQSSVQQTLPVGCDF